MVCAAMKMLQFHLKKKAWTDGSKPGYYMTGHYRGSGDWLGNIDKFRCCQMVRGIMRNFSSDHIVSDSSRRLRHGRPSQFLEFKQAEVIKPPKIFQSTGTGCSKLG